MKFKAHGILAGALLWIAGGAVLHRLKLDVGEPAQARDLPAMLGGYRTFAADWVWLNANLAWEQKDPARVRQLIDIAVRADPRAPYFWLNGARMLAYDLPVWRYELDREAPLVVQESWRTIGANEALRLLERGQRWHGDSAVLHLEMANICFYALGDRHRAAEYYRIASEQSDAPGYAARIYARLHEEETAGMTLTR